MEGRVEEIDRNPVTAGRILIQKHLGRAMESADMAEFLELYAQALWIERREMDLTAAAIVKALGGGDN